MSSLNYSFILSLNTNEIILVRIRWSISISNCDKDFKLTWRIPEGEIGLHGGGAIGAGGMTIDKK